MFGGYVITVTLTFHSGNISVYMRLSKAVSSTDLVPARSEGEIQHPYAPEERRFFLVHPFA